MLLALNLLLAGGGIALFNGYLDKRDQAAQASAAPVEDETENSPVAPVKPVGEETGRGPSDAGATRVSPGDEQTPHESETRDFDAGATTGTTTASTPRPTPDPVVTTRGPDAGTLPPRTRGRADAGASRPPRRPTDPEPAPEPDTSAEVPEPPSVDDGERVEVIASQISLVVARHQGQLTRCYQNASKSTNPNQPLEGRIRVQFSIHPDGKARSIGVVSDDTGSRVLSQCLVGLVGSWTFPSSGSDALDFVWPFDFQAPQ